MSVMTQKFCKSFVLLFSLFVASCEQAQTIGGDQQHIGKASVIDGDTLDIRENRYRFDGIDAPERGSRCGTVNVYQKASLAVADLVEGKNVECRPNGSKNGKRLIATCYVLNPGSPDTNISESLVLMGWARDWPKYSKGRYASLEATARSEGSGIWGLDCPDDLWGSRNYD